MLCCPRETEAEASDAVITSMVPVCHRAASILFDPSSTYSYVSAYFASNIDIMGEPLVKTICVSTLIGDSLVVNQVYRGCVVTFTGRDFVVDLILLDMVLFDVILGMEWLFPYHTILDCHTKTMTLSCPDLP